MKFVRRICTPPWQLGLTLFLQGNLWCPDIWEIDTGDFAVIGKDITEEVQNELPADVAISPGEKVVLVPRRLLSSAKPNLPTDG